MHLLPLWVFVASSRVTFTILFVVLNFLQENVKRFGKPKPESESSMQPALRQIRSI
jgi:heme/copper-type cytochrome/quinol oxidase subunit 3